AYLIAFDPDGKERLLWPKGPNQLPDEDVVPPHAKTAGYPPPEQGEQPGKSLLRLGHEPRGGAQAFALVMSRRPLPSFREWTRTRGGPVKWAARQACAGVLATRTDRGVSTLLEGPRIVARGEVDTKTDPPLEALRDALTTGGANYVEMIAFGVKP